MWSRFHQGQIGATIAALLAMMLCLLASWTVACGAPEATHEEISGDWFREADYAAIMTCASPGDDPELVYANQALENCLYVSPSLAPYRYEGQIDWAVGNKSNTWYLYFQSLEVVGWLANAAEATEDPSYVYKAAEIIESWYDFHHDNLAPPPYAWGDHAVANRVLNITHFLRAYVSLPEVPLSDSLFEKIHSMLGQHASWLLQEENYHPTNHGMMASMALTQIALTFPGFEDSALWRNTGIARVRERIDSDVSVEHVHLEHSAFYHLFFLRLVLRAEAYLEANGIPLFEPGDDTIEGMEQYLAYLVMPNGRLPQVGDTNSQLVTESYGHPWIAYSISDGLEGARPPQNSVVYPDAGIAILRDEWKSGSEFTNTTYLMFQSAFHSTAHKHADDLSFVLYSQGEDIFVGPGVYAYGDSKYRQYVTSAQAHNTLTIDRSSYPVVKDNIGKAGITNHCFTEAFDFVQGTHAMYGSATLKRSILLIRPSTILLVDELVSTTEHSVQQIFNLAPATHDLEYHDDGASFLVGDNGVRVEIRQLSGDTLVRHYYGSDDPLRGWASPSAGEIIPIHQLEWEKYGEGTLFVTQISVVGPNEDIPTIEVDSSDPYPRIEISRAEEAPLLIELANLKDDGITPAESPDVAPTVTPVPPTGCVFTNPDFEYDTAWGSQDPDRIWHPSGGQEGAYYSISDSRDFYQDVQLEAGQPYRLSFWAKNETDSEHYASCYISQWPGGQATISSIDTALNTRPVGFGDEYVAYKSRITDIADWTQFWGVFETDTSGTYRVYFRQDASPGSKALDTVCIAPVAVIADSDIRPEARGLAMGSVDAGKAAPERPQTPETI